MNRFSFVLTATISLFGLTAQAGVQLSRPQQATIYRDGYSLLEEKLQGLKDGSPVQLPASTDLSSVRVLRSGQPVSHVWIEELHQEEQSTERTLVGGTVLVERPVVKKKLMGYLLHLGQSLGPVKGQLKLSYGVSGLGWQPQLDVDLLAGQRLAVSLTALVHNTALDLERCEIRLASSAGQMLSRDLFAARQVSGNRDERAAEIIYDLGPRTLARGSQSLLPVLSGSNPYQMKHIWYTGTRERVRKVILVNNPLARAICPSPVRVFEGRALVAQDNAEWAAPGERLVFGAGRAALIKVERSVDTTENLANRARPFRHQIRFAVTNQGQKAIRLEVVMPKKVGSRHKTIYKFVKQPDRRPGAYFIWELDLAGQKSGQVSFRMDSEYARFGEYQSYEKARYEMM